MSVDLSQYMNRRFELRGYNCWSFVCEIWYDLTGNRISDEVVDFGWSETQSLVSSHAQKLVKLREPESPCIALMQRKGQTPHVGIYYKRNIIHLPQTGPQYQSVQHATLGFTSVSYYK